MKRKDVLKLDDLTLDKVVKIQGTQYDRKWVLKEKDYKKAAKLYARGLTYEEIAVMFGVDPRTIRYHLDEDYRLHRISTSTGKHTGIDTCIMQERVLYKRDLIRRRKIKAKTIPEI